MMAAAAPEKRDQQRASQQQRALQLAIEGAFFLPGSAAHIATVFSTGGRRLHADDVNRMWSEAKQAGRLPKLNRPKNGPRIDDDAWRNAP